MLVRSVFFWLTGPFFSKNKAISRKCNRIILSIWGIGDNNGDTDFTASYAGASDTQTTIYNGPGVARNDSTGSVPFVNFSFIADGSTDQIRFDIAGAGHVNAFSLTVVPEPSSALLLTGALGLFGIGFRRRRK